MLKTLPFLFIMLEVKVYLEIRGYKGGEVMAERALLLPRGLA